LTFPSQEARQKVEHDIDAALTSVRNATIDECAAKCDHIVEPSVDLNDAEYCDWQIGTQDCAKEIRSLKHDQTN
jgi:hypothetical protein